MPQEKNLSRRLEKIIVDCKLPSANDYIRVCRTNPYMASKYKRDIEDSISTFLVNVRKFTKPITIHFHWIEGSKRRDYDNIAFGKKFILDAMVKCGLLPDDNRKYVVGFRDSFEYGRETKVILTIEEVNDGEKVSG